MQQRHSERPGELTPQGIPSWEEVYQRAYRLLQFEFARGWQPADWEDMAQETVLKVITALAKEAVDGSRFDVWFVTVVKNVARDRYRAEVGRDGKREYLPWQGDHESEDARREEGRTPVLANCDVQALLVMLPPCERTVVELTYWYDLTSNEVADVLGGGLGVRCPDLAPQCAPHTARERTGGITPMKNSCSLSADAAYPDFAAFEAGVRARLAQHRALPPDAVQVIERLGRLVHVLRTKQHWSLEALVTRTGLSWLWLALLEQGMLLPAELTTETLHQLGRAFPLKHGGPDPAALFSTLAETLRQLPFP
jgi:RNA polymerase sigma factor (sigma-70 family)